MLVFGPLSSVFDFLTFGALLWLRHGGEESFHIGWFIESIVSAALVVFALRTRLPFRRSRPSQVMLGVTALVVLITLILPYSPLAGVMDFKALPLVYLLLIGAIVASYFITAELTKRWFFRNFGMS